MAMRANAGCGPRFYMYEEPALNHHWLRHCGRFREWHPPPDLMCTCARARTAQTLKACGMHHETCQTATETCRARSTKSPNDVTHARDYRSQTSCATVQRRRTQQRSGCTVCSATTRFVHGDQRRRRCFTYPSLSTPPSSSMGAAPPPPTAATVAEAPPPPAATTAAAEAMPCASGRRRLRWRRPYYAVINRAWLQRAMRCSHQHTGERMAAVTTSGRPRRSLRIGIRWRRAWDLFSRCFSAPR